MSFFSRFGGLCFLVGGLLFSNTTTLPAQESIQWRDISGIDSIKNRLIFVDIYTSWCGWCKEMDRTTYVNKGLSAYLNLNFATFKFDAEQHGDVYFDSVMYKYMAQHNVHELALKLSQGNLAYPLSVIVDPSRKLILPFAGYRSARDFEMILKFIVENKELNKENYEKFRDNFKSEW